MHIAEGVLQGGQVAMTTAAGLGVAAFAAQRASLRLRARAASVATLGAAAALVFAVSLVPLPTFAPGTDAHPLGSPLVGMVFGPAVGTAVTALVLVLQAFAGHGGLTSWGANLLAMGVFGAAGGWALFAALRRVGVRDTYAAAAGAMFGNVATYLVTAFVLGLALAERGGAFWPTTLGVLLAYLPVQAPIAVVEAIVSATLVGRLAEGRLGIHGRSAATVAEER